MKAKAHTKHDKRAFVGLAIVIILLIGMIVVAAAMMIHSNNESNEPDSNVGVMEETSLESPLMREIHKSKYYLAKNERYYKSSVHNLSENDYAVVEDELGEDMATFVVRLVNTGADKQSYIDDVPADLSKDYLVLVNKKNGLGKYEPDDLVTLSDEYNTGSAPKLRKVAAEAFVRMADAARADGIELKNVSGYRSYDVQDGLYKMYVERDGEWEADTYSSHPGYSEHQAGLATDINWVDTDFESTPAYAWLQEHAAEYGFIMRYPKNMAYVTGFDYEPWHYRYVGPEVAQAVVNEGITYDEYYAYYIDK